jgi:UDP-N-acetyl-D-mannosaminuronic acid dehydrogenase
MKSFAKAGFAAGPCLLKDTLQLSAFSGNNFFLGHSAMLINEGLPNFIVTQLRQQHKLRDKVVAVLGMAFKSESDDTRESLSFKLRKLLMVEAKEVLCTDPYVVDARLLPLENVVQRADVIILGAPHGAYRDLHFAPEKVVVDVWGFWPNAQKSATEGTTAQ